MEEAIESGLQGPDSWESAFSQAGKFHQSLTDDSKTHRISRNDTEISVIVFNALKTLAMDLQ